MERKANLVLVLATTRKKKPVVKSLLEETDKSHHRSSRNLRTTKELRTTYEAPPRSKSVPRRLPKRPGDKRPTQQDEKDCPDKEDKMASEHTSGNTERYLGTLMEKLHTLEIKREERRRQEQHEAELRRKEELASRELAFKIEMAERDKQFQTLIQHLADSQKADSERLRAAEKEHTLALMQQRAEQADRWKAEKAEREHQAQLKAIPSPQSMAKDQDLADYIEMFEANMQSREIPKHAWAKHLVPLLHSRVTPSIASLPPADKLNFAVLKETLLATAYATTKYASRALWLSNKKPDASLKAYGNQLLRLCKRFTEKAESVHDACELFATEKFIQDLPPDIGDYVREKEPKKVSEAADLAAKQFTIQNIDEFKHDSSKPWTGKAKEKYSDNRPGKARWHVTNHNFKTGANTSVYQPAIQHETINASDQATRSKPQGADKGADKGADSSKGFIASDPKITSNLSGSSSSQRFNGMCHICKKWGHRAADCRTRVSVAVVPCLAEPAADALVVEGLIDGQKVSDMLCDSGANISMIAEHLMPKQPKFCGYVAFGSVGDHTNTYRAILVPTILFGKELQLFAAVAPRSHLPADVILGRNVPGVVITWSVGDVKVSTSQETQSTSTSAPSEEKVFVEDSAVEKRAVATMVSTVLKS